MENQPTQSGGTVPAVGSTAGSAMDATQAAEAKLREQVWRNENAAERFCDNAAEVKLVLAELTKLRELRERQAAMIRRLQATIEDYEEQAVDEGRC